MVRDLIGFTAGRSLVSRLSFSAFLHLDIIALSYHQDATLIFHGAMVIPDCGFQVVQFGLDLA